MPGRTDTNDIERCNDQSPLLPNSHTQPIHSTNPLNDIRTILFNDYINILLIFLPFALLSGALEWSPTVVFITNFFALMPLAALLSFATDELSKSVGQGIGGLLNVTFGNATELIVGIVALKDGQVKLIQTTMLGSILSSLLFVSAFSKTLLMGGAWNHICCWRDADCGIRVQQYDCSDNEFVHVRRDRCFNSTRRL